MNPAAPNCPVLILDWEALPRLLQELCEGHGAYMTELYRLDYPSGGRAWLCTGCYIREYLAAGRPAQHARACEPHDLPARLAAPVVDKVRGAPPA